MVVTYLSVVAHIQYNTIQYSTIQYNTALFPSLRNSFGSNKKADEYQASHKYTRLLTHSQIVKKKERKGTQARKEMHDKCQ